MAKEPNANGKSRERRPPPPPWIAPAPDPMPPPEEVKVIATGGTAEPGFGLAPEQQALPGAPSSYLVTARRNATEFIRGSFAITPDDANGFARPALGVWVGGAGNITCKLQDGSTAVFTAVPAGTNLPIVATQIMATGTSATLLVGLR